MGETYWVIAHGDPDVTGVLYWVGYVSEKKDHFFDRDLDKAIRFCREIDARQAGVGLTKGTKFLKITV